VDVVCITDGLLLVTDLVEMELSQVKQKTIGAAGY